MEPSQSIPWNIKGTNGINCFFSEATYTRFLGKETFETRLLQNLKKVGIDHLPPVLPAKNDTSTEKTETLSKAKEAGNISDVEMSRAEKGQDAQEVPEFHKKRKTKKQSKRRLKNDVANQTDSKTKSEEFPSQNVSTIRNESADQNDSSLNSESASQAKEDVADMLKRAREYASQKTEGTTGKYDSNELSDEKRNVTVSAKPQLKLGHSKEEEKTKEDNLGHEEHKVKSKEYETKTKEHGVKSKETEAESKSTENIEFDLKTINDDLTIKTGSDEVKMVTDSQEKHSEKDFSSIAQDTEMPDALHIIKESERSNDDNIKVKPSQVTAGDTKEKISKTSTEKTAEDFDRIEKKTKLNTGDMKAPENLNRSSVEKVNTRHDKQMIRKDEEERGTNEMLNRGSSERENSRATDSSSDEEEDDDVRGHGKQRKSEKFHERKRNKIYMKDRIRYDKTGKYIPCISTIRSRRWSNLLYKEQHRFLALTHKYRQGFPNYPTEAQIKEIEELKDLESRVQEEQKEYNEFLKEMFDRCAEDYDYIHPEVKKYVDEKLSHVLPRVNLYPRYYNLQEKISLALPGQLPGPNGPVLQYVRPLLELGVVPKAVLPNMLPNAPLPATGRSYTLVNDNFPATRPSVVGQHVWNHEPCSRDPNAEELGMRFGVNIVMSATALKCLIDLQDTEWGQHWELPVTIKEYDVFDGEKKIKHKVVYLDKPVYQSSSLTGREKNLIYYKNALKSLIIRTQQKGHVFTNIRTQHLVQSATPQVENVKFQKGEGSKTPRGDPQTGKLDNKGEEKAKDLPKDNVEQTKRTVAGKAKANDHATCASSKDVRRKSSVEIEDDKHNSKTGVDSDVLSSDHIEDASTESKNMDKEEKTGKGSKTSGGMFDIETGDIDDLETFGMEKSWKLMLKGKHQPVTEPSSTRIKVGHTGEDLSELEKLKTELKGLETKAKKETEKVHNLSITTPTGKFYSSSRGKMSGSTTPGGYDKDKPLSSTKLGAAMAVDSVATSQEQDLAVKSGQIEPAAKTTGPHNKDSNKSAAPKQVLNLNTVETLASSGMKLSSGLTLRRRSSIAAEPSVGIAELPKSTMVQKSLTKENNKKAEDEAGITSNSLRSKKVVQQKLESVQKANKVIRDSVLYEDEDDDDTNDENDELVIDIPDSPVKGKTKFKPDKDTLAVPAPASPSTPASPPDSPPASPLAPASPPASPMMDDTSPGIGLRNACVIIPLGDDSLDQNIIDHSIEVDYSTKKEGHTAADHIKTEVKSENQTYRKELEIQNFEKLLMSPLPIRKDTMKSLDGTELPRISSEKPAHSIIDTHSSVDDTNENNDKTNAGVVRRRSSLRSATKDLENSNDSHVYDKIQTRRNTRHSGNAEQEMKGNLKEDKSASVAGKLSEEAKDEEAKSMDVNEEVGPWTRRRHSEIALRSKELKENMRQTRSRSSSHDKVEENRKSSIPDTRITKHSHDSVQSRASTPDEEILTPTRKKRKTNIIESDEEEDVTMDTTEKGTRQSLKTRMAEELQSEVAKRPGRRGRLPKNKKAQKSQDTSEADKIKELAEKLKRQMKEKQEKQQTEAQQLDINTHHVDGNANTSQNDQQKHSYVKHTNLNHEKAVASVKPVARDEDRTNYKDHEVYSSEITQNQKHSQTNLKGASSEGHEIVKGTHREKAAGIVTEGANVPPSKKSSGKDGSSTNLDALLNLQSEMLKPSSSMSSQECFVAKSGLTNLAFPVSGNVIYTQWNLGGLSIMIRCNHHGNIKDAKHKDGYVYVTPKLEYQAVFGVEQETISEIARNWISVYIRPTCTLLRARINVFTSEIVLLEEMDFPSLLPPNTAFNQYKAFGQLHKVCQKLTGLPVGSYLLTHSPGDEEINLLKCTEGNRRGAYDLHFRHTTMMAGSKGPCRKWLPIDPAIITSQHRKLGRIPLTFQPKDSHMAKKMAGKNRKKKKQRLGVL